MQAILHHITEQLKRNFGERIVARQFSDYVLMFEEMTERDSEGVGKYRSIGILKLVSDRQFEITTANGTITIIGDRPITNERLYNVWRAIYTWP